VEGVVLAADLHLQDTVGLGEGADIGMSEKGDKAALEGAEAAFDFALGLGRWGDQMGDTQSAQSPLELAAGIAAVVRGTGAEKAQCVGVDGLREADALKSFPEVAEVGPGGVGRHEASSDIEAGMVVDGEQEGLHTRGGPPLMDGAVVLPEFAETGAAKATVGAVFFLRFWDEIRKGFLT
jgi:hypothetical protein